MSFITPHPPRLVCCERRTAWADALRRMSIARLEIMEVRNLTDLDAALVEWPRAIAVVEMTPASAATTLQWLLELPSRHPLASLVVAGNPQLRASGLRAQSWGALAWLENVRQVATLRSTLYRYVEQMPRPMVTPDDPFAVLSSLPAWAQD